jgi:predicted CXXCH cytochrome family protein
VKFAAILALIGVGVAGASPDGCARCHRAETASFAQAGMTHAIVRAEVSEILKTPLVTQIGLYKYEIVRTAEAATYTVSSGQDTLSLKLDWALGHGSTGQTYLYRQEGRWYESRVSYFAKLRGLDITIGQQDLVPRNVVEAAGRLVDGVEARNCFQCHATNVTRTVPPGLSGMVPGIQCERCHGPSHTGTKKLGALTTEEMSDFCGQCHRTWSQIAEQGPRGIQNVRFQPYRLAISKCYDATDRRIRCTTCHDPHRPLEKVAVSYDNKCLACHSGAKVKCKVATTNCVTCHMPRLDLPGAHNQFTDHKIRVVRAGEAYPD